MRNGPEIVKGTLPPDQLGVKALDDVTFEVTLNTPAPFFPLLAAYHPAVLGTFPCIKHVSITK
jgi:oligopeptide transport system substrate-binding protein